MLDQYPILRGRYFDDLFAQPAAIARTVDGLRGLRLPNREDSSRIILTGMGSSLHALHPLQIRLIRSGRPAMLVETAELVHAQRDLLTESALIVAVSQSGQSAETVTLLDAVRSQGRRSFVVGVTNTAGSPLATQADFVVPLAAGPEFSVSCKTYLATLVGLAWLAAAMTGDAMPAVLDDLASAADAVDGYLQSGVAHVSELIDRLAGIRHLFVTGRGPSLAATFTGALILKESTRFHAEGMSCPAFRHGPLEMVSPHLFAAVFAGDGETAVLNRRLFDDIVAAGGRAALIGAPDAAGVFRLPAVSARLRPVVEILPLQMMSLALAVQAGREPGVFERASKVTATS